MAGCTTEAETKENYAISHIDVPTVVGITPYPASLSVVLNVFVNEN
jgi:hypothetical protein